MNPERFKPFIFLIWLSLAACFGFFFLQHGIPLKDYPSYLESLVKNSGITGMILFLLIYAIRPVILFPPSIFCAAAGLLFGPFVGSVITISGELLGANIAYSMGKFFGSEMISYFSDRFPRVSSLHQTLNQSDFLAVFCMRLLFLPFDPVGFLCGGMKLNRMSYTLGTFLGILPGTLSFVFLGGSLHEPHILWMSLLFFLISILLARLLKRII